MPGVGVRATRFLGIPSHSVAAPTTLQRAVAASPSSAPRSSALRPRLRRHSINRQRRCASSAPSARCARCARFATSATRVATHSEPSAMSAPLPGASAAAPEASHVRTPALLSPPDTHDPPTAATNKRRHDDSRNSEPVDASELSRALEQFKQADAPRQFTPNASPRRKRTRIYGDRFVARAFTADADGTRFIPNRTGQDLHAAFSLLHEEGSPATPSRPVRRTPHNELHFQNSGFSFPRESFKPSVDLSAILQPRKPTSAIPPFCARSCSKTPFRSRTFPPRLSEAHRAGRARRLLAQRLLCRRHPRRLPRHTRTSSASQVSRRQWSRRALCVART